MNGIFKKLAIVAFIAPLFAAPSAFAWDGYGRGSMMGPGYGRHMMDPEYGYNGMMGYRGHMGWWGDRDNDTGITQEQAEKLEAARDSFYRQTRDLRDQIYDQNVQIRRELSKDTPDKALLQDLQKGLSKLESELAQKRLDYQLEVRKIAPELGRNSAAEGYGPGAGYCWR